jgi:DNA-binding MarR family transcriptional regulator
MTSDQSAARLAVLEEIGVLGPLRREMAKCALPELQAGGGGALWHLAKHGPLRMSDLAAGLRVAPSVVSRQVSDLVDGGYLDRTADPIDGRACVLAISDHGQAALDAVLARVDRRFEERLVGWTSAELLRLAADIRRLREDLLAPPSDAAEPNRYRVTADAGA